ncbi:MAG: hypothetical protein AMK75_02725 [Planctomycetes bacterium SM23_65]|nr:MAG: hypothetical protein AMK75_02725 [Planctomycetes bacterium SM23_65]
MGTFNKVMLCIGIALAVVVVVAIVLRIVWFQRMMRALIETVPGVETEQQWYVIEDSPDSTLDEVFTGSYVDNEMDEPRPAEGDSESSPPPVGPAFARYLDGLQRSGLDVVVVFDSTGSMGDVILQLKRRVREFVKVVSQMVPNARVGFVAYRDRRKYDLDDYEYTVKYVPLTKLDREGVRRLERFLRDCEAYGGGDIPEAVQDGVSAAVSRSRWREGTKKVIIVVGDAPPRPENDGLTRTYELCRQWHEQSGGMVSAIDTTGGSRILDEFKKMAAAGGGESSALSSEKDIIQELVVCAFGSKWRREVTRFYLRRVAPRRVVGAQHAVPLPGDD